jgi:hypothetical protein
MHQFDTANRIQPKIPRKDFKIIYYFFILIFAERTKERPGKDSKSRVVGI